MKWSVYSPSLGLRRARLQVEELEGRELLDAQPLAALPALDPQTPTALLVHYTPQAIADSSGALTDQVYQVALPAKETLQQALAAYRADPRVLYAEPDYTMQISQVPNDPSFSNQWGLENTGQSNGTVNADIDATRAWDVTTGSLNTVVAVIDTGIDYRHIDLYKNIWINQGEIPPEVRARLTDIDGDGKITFWDLNDPRNQGTGKITDLNKNGRIDGADLLYAYRADGKGGWADGISEDGDKYVDDIIGWNFVDNNNKPFDNNSHGTHVAGIIGALGDNGVGVAGVDWKVQLMALKFLDAKGVGSTSAAIEALNYAVAKGAQISNNSWATTGYSQAMYDAINAARSKGHIYVAAAGNGGSDGKGDNNDLEPSYPASYNLDNVISVAATSRTDKLAGFSNYGAVSVDLAAPGMYITSTTPYDRYNTFSGTSMATPYVAGVAALLKSAHPNWTYTQIIDQILGTVDPLPTLAGKTVTGGRLNAGRALTEVIGDHVGPRVVSAVPNASGANPVSSVRVTFSEAIDPNSFTLSDIASFVGPNGNLSVSSIKAVAGSEGKSFDLFFTTQSVAGTYRLTLGPQILDLAGNPMDQNHNGTMGESTADRYTATFVINPIYTFSATGLPVALVDYGVKTSTLTITQDISIVDLNVALNISHTFDNDLYIHLIGPDGTDVLLVNRRGGTADNFTNTIFDDQASTSIVNGTAPFTGTFQPEGSLAAFNGKSAKGTWTLVVEDRQKLDTGKLNAWSLTIEANGGSGSSQSMSLTRGDGEAATSSVRSASLSGGSSSRPTVSAPTPSPAPFLLAESASTRSVSPASTLTATNDSSLPPPAENVDHHLADALFAGWGRSTSVLEQIRVPTLEDRLNDTSRLGEITG